VLPHRYVATSATLTTENTALLSLCLRFRGNVFNEPLPSNGLLRISGVMSQYEAHFPRLNELSEQKLDTLKSCKAISCVEDKFKSNVL
jgi:hypothetical protein